MRRTVSLGAAGERELALVCHRLAGLLRCGCALVDALEALAEDEGSVRERELTSSLSRLVASGVPLSSALVASRTAAMPADAALVSELSARVRAAEADGALADAFDDLEAMLLQRAAHRTRLRAALLYPLCAAACLTLACLFLLVRVVPALTGGGLSLTPSWHARPLIWIGGVVSGSAPLFGPWTDRIVLLLTLALLGVVLRRVAAGRGSAAGMGPARGVAEALALARAAASIGRLHAASVPLDEALSLASSTCASRRLAQGLSMARDRLVAGASLGEALRNAPGVPLLFARFVAAGEASGALSSALSRAAEHHEQEAQRQLQRIEVLAGPTVLAVFGALLLWVVISILLPVYEQALVQVAR